MPADSLVKYSYLLFVYTPPVLQKKKKNTTFKAIYNIYSISMKENAAKTRQIKRQGKRKMNIGKYD